jgi:hypothetical protein
VVVVVVSGDDGRNGVRGGVDISECFYLSVTLPPGTGFRNRKK